jgi:hypothetical protein
MPRAPEDPANEAARVSAAAAHSVAVLSYGPAVNPAAGAAVKVHRAAVVIGATTDAGNRPFETRQTIDDGVEEYLWPSLRFEN